MRRCAVVTGVLGAVASLIGASAVAAVTPNPAVGRIAFGRADASGRYSLWTIAPDTGLRARVTRGCGWDWHPSWSPDGRKIVFARACGGRSGLDLYIVGAGGRNLRRLVRTNTVDEWPSWSPDGTRIVFVSGQPNVIKPGQPSQALQELWTVRPDGRGLRRLTRNRYLDATPTWSPDGTKILFVSWRGARRGLWVMPARGGTAQFLGLRGGEPAWSPDGTRIAFAQRRRGVAQETVDLWVANADGTGAHRILKVGTGNVAHHPSWAPDGRRIVYMNSRDGALWTIGADGSGRRRLTRTAIEDVDPEWLAPRPAAPSPTQ